MTNTSPRTVVFRDSTRTGLQWEAITPTRNTIDDGAQMSPAIACKVAAKFAAHGWRVQVDGDVPGAAFIRDAAAGGSMTSAATAAVLPLAMVRYADLGVIDITTIEAAFPSGVPMNVDAWRQLISMGINVEYLASVLMIGQDERGGYTEAVMDAWRTYQHACSVCQEEAGKAMRGLAEDDIGPAMRAWKAARKTALLAYYEDVATAFLNAYRIADPQ